MHLGCYGRGGPLSPCANSRHVRAENQRHRRSVRVNWWRAFSFPTRSHVLIRWWRGFFVQARGVGHNFCVVLHRNGQSVVRLAVLGHGPLASWSGQLFSDESFGGRSRSVARVGAAACHFSCRVVWWHTAGARSPLGRYFTSRRQVNVRLRRSSVHHSPRKARCGPNRRFFDSLRDREAFSTVSGAHWRCGAQLRLVGDFRSRVPVRDSLGDGRWRHVE